MASCALKQNVGDLERLGCLAAGGLLLARGSSSGRLLPAVLGGLFIYRGLAGYCCGYDALGIDTRPADERVEG